MLLFFCGSWGAIAFFVNNFLTSLVCEYPDRTFRCCQLVKIFGIVGALPGISVSMTGCLVISASNMLFVCFVIVMVFETSELVCSLPSEPELDTYFDGQPSSH